MSKKISPINSLIVSKDEDSIDDLTIHEDHYTSENKQLKANLTRTHAELECIRAETTKKCNSLNAQIEAAQKEKNDTSRKFFNLAEDYKELEAKLSQFVEDRNQARTKHDLLIEKVQRINESANHKENALTTELVETKKSVTNLRNEYEQKEKKQREEYIERIGGVEEALEQSRGDIENMEEEKRCLSNKIKILKEEAQLQNSSEVSKRKILEKDLIHTRRENDNLKRKMVQTMQNGQKLETKISLGLAEIENYKNKIQTVASEAEESKNVFTTDIKKKITEINSLRTSIKLCQDEIDQLKKRVSQLQVENQMQNSTLQKNKKVAKDEIEEYKTLYEGLKDELENRQTEINTILNKAQHESANFRKIELNISKQNEENRNQILILQNEKLHIQNISQNQQEKISRIEHDVMVLLGRIEQKENDLLRLRNQKDEEIGGMHDDMQHKKAKLESMSQNFKEEKNKLLNQLQDMSRKHEKEIIVLKNEGNAVLEENQHTIGLLKQNHKKSDKHVAELQNKIELLQQTIGHAKNDNEILHIQVKEQKDVLRSDSKRIETLHLQLIEKEKETKEIKNDYLRNQSEMQSFKGDLDITKIKVMELNKELSICMSLKTKSETTVLNQEQQIKTLEDNQIRCNGKMDALEHKLSKAKHDYSLLFKEKRDLESRVAQESSKVSDELYELKDIIKCQSDQHDLLLTQIKLEKEQASKDEKSLQETINELCSKLEITQETLKQQNVSHDKEKINLKQKLQDTERDILCLNEKYRAQINSHEEDKERTEEKIKATELKVEELNSQLDSKSRNIERISLELHIERSKKTEISSKADNESKISQKQRYLSDAMQILTVRVNKVLNRSSQLEQLDVGTKDMESGELRNKNEIDVTQGSEVYPKKTKHSSRHIKSNQIIGAEFNECLEDNSSPDKIISKAEQYLMRKRREKMKNQTSNSSTSKENFTNFPPI